MFEERPVALRQRVKELATQASKSGRPSDWFETLYQESKGDTQQIPWAKLKPHPYLSEWLENRAIQGNGKTALVVGCGLGDDAEALSALGFTVTAFDVAPSAIAWCQQRFPDSTVTYQVADLFTLPEAWQRSFDLVVEIRNIQALPLSVRSEAIKAVATTVAPEGQLLLTTRIRMTDEVPDGPPWPLSESELSQFQQWGLADQQRDIFTVSEQPPVTQIRLVLHQQGNDRLSK
ncbi:MAG: class I SAM-dependent methyltransferase [Cyanobacteria bacterium P01_F01_bin.150]